MFVVTFAHVFLLARQEEKVAVAKAKSFLERNTYSADDPYTTALSAYALALLRSPYAPVALHRLNHMAITQGSCIANIASASLHIPPIYGLAAWPADVSTGDTLGALRDNKDDARFNVFKSGNILHISTVTSL